MIAPALLLALLAIPPTTGPGPAASVWAPAPAAAAVRDTVVPLTRGDRVLIENPAGDLLVGTWDRSSLSVESASRETVSVDLVRTDGGVRVRIRERKGRSWSGVLRVTLPAWAALEARGREGEVTVEGVRGGIVVRTMDGPVRLRDVAGGVRVRTVEGSVLVDGVEGEVEVRGVDEGVRVYRARAGSISVHTVDGDVVLEDVEASGVDVSTVDGDLAFSGPLRAGGVYRLVTHDGDVTATVPGSPDARVTVSTFDGSFDSDFPVVVERFRGGELLSFTLGQGGAELQLEAFDGEIRLRRGG